MHVEDELVHKFYLHLVKVIKARIKVNKSLAHAVILADRSSHTNSSLNVLTLYTSLLSFNHTLYISTAVRQEFQDQ